MLSTSNIENMINQTQAPSRNNKVPENVKVYQLTIENLRKFDILNGSDKKEVEQKRKKRRPKKVQDLDKGLNKLIGSPETKPKPVFTQSTTKVSPGLFRLPRLSLGSLMHPNYYDLFRSQHSHLENQSNEDDKIVGDEPDNDSVEVQEDFKQDDKDNKGQQ